MSRVSAQADAAAEAPSKQNAKIPAPIAASAQPSGLKACEDVLGVDRGRMISCSMLIFLNKTTLWRNHRQ